MIAFGGRRGPHRSGPRCRGRPIERREAGREGCLWPNAASQGRPPDGSGGESERSTQNGRAKTLCGGGGGGGGGSNSELPQAGFPESGEVSGEVYRLFSTHNTVDDCLECGVTSRVCRATISRIVDTRHRRLDFGHTHRLRATTDITSHTRSTPDTRGTRLHRHTCYGPIASAPLQRPSIIVLAIEIPQAAGPYFSKLAHQVDRHDNCGAQANTAQLEHAPQRTPQRRPSHPLACPGLRDALAIMHGTEKHAHCRSVIYRRLDVAGRECVGRRLDGVRGARVPPTAEPTAERAGSDAERGRGQREQRGEAKQCAWRGAHVCRSRSALFDFRRASARSVDGRSGGRYNVRALAAFPPGYYVHPQRASSSLGRTRGTKRSCSWEVQVEADGGHGRRAARHA